MRLPAPLLRSNPSAHKNDFGHVLILAGSPGMIGACALTALACMRAGAGLVTLGIAKSLNPIVQKKISPVIMTLPLNETSAHTLSVNAFSQIEKRLSSFDAIALGPGLSQNKNTQQLIFKILRTCHKPLVLDADALNAIAKNPEALTQCRSIKILTPHPGEMARLTGLTTHHIEKNRKGIAFAFAKKYHCILVLKGNKTVVASPDGKIYVNKTGNAGMATAGSGDVLTGMIAAFVGQGVTPFEAAKFAVYLHGKAGDLAAKKTAKASMIAIDIIDKIPNALKLK